MAQTEKEVTIRETTVCDCPAGYGMNHAIHCALVQGPPEDEDGGLLDFPRSAIKEAITLGVE